MVSASQILNASILVVGDQEANVTLLERMLLGAGYTSVSSTRNPHEDTFGSISVVLRRMASLLVDCWEGAALRSRLRGNAAPLTAMLDFYFQSVVSR